MMALGVFYSFLSFLLFVGGVVFLVFVIVFMGRYLALKKEQNQLFREYIQVVKEKKSSEG